MSTVTPGFRSRQYACRVVSHPAATVTQAEDSSGRLWALKRIQGDHQSVREAERLVKLKGHPLIVPLQSVFVDNGVTYLQMPFYRHGNLRTWVEQMKASHPCNQYLSSCLLQRLSIRVHVNVLHHLSDCIEHL